MEDGLCLLGRKSWKINECMSTAGWRDSNDCKLILQASSLHVTGQKNYQAPWNFPGISFKREWISSCGMPAGIKISLIFFIRSSSKPFEVDTITRFILHVKKQSSERVSRLFRVTGIEWWSGDSYSLNCLKPRPMFFELYAKNLCANTLKQPGINTVLFINKFKLLKSNTN